MVEKRKDEEPRMNVSNCKGHLLIHQLSPLPMAMFLRLQEDQVMIPEPSLTADTPHPRGRIPPITVLLEGNHRARTVRHRDRAEPPPGREDSVRQCSGRPAGASSAINFKVA
jgi:hypothetical protein